MDTTTSGSSSEQMKLALESMACLQISFDKKIYDFVNGENDKKRKLEEEQARAEEYVKGNFPILLKMLLEGLETHLNVYVDDYRKPSKLSIVIPSEVLYIPTLEVKDIAEETAQKLEPFLYSYFYKVLLNHYKQMSPEEVQRSWIKIEHFKFVVIPTVARSSQNWKPLDNYTIKVHVSATFPWRLGQDRP